MTFQAVRDIEQLSDIPKEDLAQIPKGNIQILTQLSTAVRAQPSVIQAAKTQRPDEFVRHVQDKHPSQHLEATVPLRFVLSESEAAEVNEALDMAQERGAGNRNGALLQIAIDYRAAALIEELSKESK